MKSLQHFASHRLEPPPRFDHTFRSSPHLVFIVSAGGRCLYANRLAREACGFKNRMIQHSPVSGIPVFGAHVVVMFEKLRSGEQNWIQECQILDNDQARWFDVHAHRFCDERNEFAGAVISFHDITIRKQQESDYSAQQQRLEARVDVGSKFHVELPLYAHIT